MATRFMNHLLHNSFPHAYKNGIVFAKKLKGFHCCKYRHLVFSCEHGHISESRLQLMKSNNQRFPENTTNTKISRWNWRAQHHENYQQKRTISQRASRTQGLWTISDPYCNPVAALNEFTQVPVLPSSDQLFSPVTDDMHVAQEFFKKSSSNGLIKTQKGIVDLKDLPLTDHPEVAFIGRSNVGKSSLLKEILKDSNVKVPVSKKPGHTRVLKFYHVGSSFSLVDMPGYGYNMPEYFVESMEEYLKTRKNLLKVFFLVDGKVGLQPADELAIEMMEEFSRPYVIVLTKIDKAAPSCVLRNIVAVQKKLSQDAMCCFPQPFLTSSTNGWGIPMLQSFITYITGAHNLKSIT